MLFGNRCKKPKNGILNAKKAIFMSQKALFAY